MTVTPQVTVMGLLSMLNKNIYVYSRQCASVKNICATHTIHRFHLYQLYENQKLHTCTS